MGHIGDTDANQCYRSVPHLATSAKWSVPLLAAPRPTTFGAEATLGHHHPYLYDPRSYRHAHGCVRLLFVPPSLSLLAICTIVSVVCVVCVFRPVSDVPSARLSPRVQCVAARVAWVLAFAHRVSHSPWPAKPFGGAGWIVRGEACDGVELHSYIYLTSSLVFRSRYGWGPRHTIRGIDLCQTT